MSETKKYFELLDKSAHRALRGQTPSSLIAYSFNIDFENKTILLKAHFFEDPSDDDIENIQVVETEIDTDFLDQFKAATEIEVVAFGEQPNLLPGVAYRRGL